jgi:hypothetical protein
MQKIYYTQQINQPHGAKSFLQSSLSASQKILHILWDPQVHYCTHKSLQTVLSLATSIQSTPSNSTCLSSILILSSQQYLSLLSGLFLSCFSTKTQYAFLTSHMSATCCTYLTLVARNDGWENLHFFQPVSNTRLWKRVPKTPGQPTGSVFHKISMPLHEVQMVFSNELHKGITTHGVL